MVINYKLALVKFCLAVILVVALTLGSNGQIINTIAGNGTVGYNGDGIAATAAELAFPKGDYVDADYNVYIGDFSNERVREITAGVISTVAGNGNTGYSGDGGPATDAELNSPAGVAVDDSGNIYFADFLNNVVRKVSAKTQIITTIAGNGTGGLSGDGGPATDAELHDPLNVTVDTAGNVFIADTYNYCVRKVTKATGIITRLAGTGTYGYSGDGGLATNAEMTNPWGVVVDDSDNVYITDTYNDRIRKVNGYTGIITTIAGDGVGGYSGDGGQATNAEIYYPTMLALDKLNNLYIADYENNVDREVIKSTGIMTTVAGNGTGGFSGDGGPATDAELNGTWCVAIDPSGNIYCIDEANNRVREVTVVAVPVITVTPSPASICSGDSVNLTASGAKTYSWSPAIGLSATSGSSVMAFPLVTTTYTITGTDTAGQAGITTVTVTVIQVTPIQVEPQSPSVCNGVGVTLLADTSGGNYTWSPALALNSTTGDSVIAKPATNTTYTVSGIDSLGCQSTGTVVVTVIPAPPLTVLPLSPFVCSGQSIQLKIEGGSSNFVWSPKTGLSDTTGDSVMAGPGATITYTVSGFDSAGCFSTGTEVVSVVPAPNKPAITVSVTGDSLVSSATTDNQWFFDGQPLTDSTRQVLIIKGHIKGWYTVTVTNEANGCSTTSDSTTSINQLSVISEQLSIYPNPTNGSVFVKINSAALNINDWSLQVIDVLGRTLYTMSSLNYNNEIDLTELPGGVYFITVVNKTSRAVFKVVKEN